MKNVLFLNGPPGSGKSTIAEYLEKEHGFVRLSYKTPLVSLVQRFYGVSDTWWQGVYQHGTKDLPQAVLGGLSCRQALIHIAEGVVKPVFGKGIFGDWMYSQLCSMPRGTNVVIDDLGFEEEITSEMINDNSLVGLILWVTSEDTRGVGWNGDSRNYVQKGFDSDIILNTMDEDVFPLIDKIITDFPFNQFE